MLDERASELFGETMADDSDTAVPKIPAAKEAVTEAEMNFALDFVAKLISNMKLNAEARAAEKPEGEELITTETATVYPKINIVGEDSSVLIGHHGETLDAIQYLVNLSALRRTKSGDGDYVKIVVDVFEIVAIIEGGRSDVGRALPQADTHDRSGHRARPQPLYGRLGGASPGFRAEAAAGGHLSFQVL